MASGERLVDYELVKEKAVNFYKNLFSEQGSFNVRMHSKVAEIITSHLNVEQAKLLTTEVTKKLSKLYLVWEKELLQDWIAILLGFTNRTGVELVLM